MRDEYKEEVRRLYRRNPELERWVRRKRSIFFLKLIGVELIVWLVAAEIWKYGLPVPAVVIGVLAATVLPFVLLKPFRTVGTGWMGEIIGTSEELRRDSSKHDPVNVSTLRMGTVKKFLNITVESGGGKRHVFRVFALYGRVYGRGTRVLCLRGIEYPIPLNPTEHTVCPFCGGRMLTAVDHCAGCGAKQLDVSLLERKLR